MERPVFTKTIILNKELMDYIEERIKPDRNTFEKMLQRLIKEKIHGKS